MSPQLAWKLLIIIHTDTKGQFWDSIADLLYETLHFKGLKSDTNSGILVFLTGYFIPITHRGAGTGGAGGAIAPPKFLDSST